jgi:hypothetical protein
LNLNKTALIIQQKLQFKGYSFLGFSRQSGCQSWYTSFLALFTLPPEGSGKLFFVDSSRGPTLLYLEVVLVQADVRQLVLQASKQEQVHWH